MYVHKEFFIILVFQCFHGQRKDRERQYSVVASYKKGNSNVTL